MDIIIAYASVFVLTFHLFWWYWRRGN